MILNSDAIDSRGYIDSRYTCDADNSSPELRWENIPDKVAGFALVAEDPDASHGLFTHWVIYNIPTNIHHLPAGIPPQEVLPNGIKQGVNSSNKLGYAGPCPPAQARDHGRSDHHYVFRLYALAVLPEISTRATREELLKAIEPYILEQTELTGLYHRNMQKAG